jgi:hypothetical protein
VGACAVGMAAGNDSVANLQSALAHCAAITSADARLACYDALVVGRTKVGSPASPASPAPASSAPPAAAKEDFGLTTVQKQKVRPQKQTESITAAVTGLGTSAIGRLLVKLDNGQSWELDSADPLLAVGNLVTIERGALGSFLLTTPSRRAHHVRRIQ